MLRLYDCNPDSIVTIDLISSYSYQVHHLIDPIIIIIIVYPHPDPDPLDTYWLIVIYWHQDLHPYLVNHRIIIYPQLILNEEFKYRLAPDHYYLLHLIISGLFIIVRFEYLGVFLCYLANRVPFVNLVIICELLKWRYFYHHWLKITPFRDLSIQSYSMSQY